MILWRLSQAVKSASTGDSPYTPHESPYACREAVKAGACELHKCWIYSRVHSPVTGNNTHDTFASKLQSPAIRLPVLFAHVTLA